MKFYTDHYFYIGYSHLNSGKPCQDYALSKSSDSSGYAVVSDGCSTGGHTDIGARLYALSIANVLGVGTKADFSVFEVETQAKQKVEEVKKSLGLDRSDLLATCMYSFLSQDQGIIRILGDGVIALKYTDGRISLKRFDWANNAPYYPAYTESDSDLYVQNIHGGVLENAKLRLIEVEYRDSVCVSEKETSIPFADAIGGFSVFISTEEIQNDLEFVALFSDGVTQVDSVDWKSATLNFLDFKSLSGEFAKRRMIRGIKDYQKVGHGPVDDISYAVVRIDREGN
ncbi:MAG: protein phosphatase 2C domain-containing protein [Patescibacteria group bacterium]